MGVSKNRGGPPKWMVYKAKAYSNGWFGGKTHYFRKHPYTISPFSSKYLRSSESPALLGIKPGQDLENFANWNAWELGFSQLKYSWISWKKLNSPPVEQKLSGDENGSAGKCRWVVEQPMLFPRSWLKHLLKRTGCLLVVDKHPRNPKPPISYQLSQLENGEHGPTSQSYDDLKINAAWPKGRKGRIQVRWGRSSLRCPGRMM